MGAGVENVVGPFVLGTNFDILLLGASIVSAQNYFRHTTYVNDRIYRIVVLCLGTIALAQSALNLHTIWNMTVRDFGDFGSLAVAPWSFEVGASFTGATTFITQAYYSHRLWRLSGNKWYLPALIMFTSILQFGFAVACTAVGHELHFFARFDEFTYGILLWLYGAVAGDILITAGLVYYLKKAKRSTDFLGTKSLLDQVIGSTLENNSVTCAVACVDAILFLVSNTGWHACLNLCLSKLYFLSLLASLNSRRKFAKEARRRASSSLPQRPIFSQALAMQTHPNIQVPSTAAKFVRSIRQYSERISPSHTESIVENGFVMEENLLDEKDVEKALWG